MESMFMDQSPVNPRKSLAVTNISANSKGGSCHKFHNTISSSSAACSQYRAMDLFLNVHGGAGAAGFGAYGPRLPPPINSSLPFFSPAACYALGQPPLLSLPYPSNKFSSTEGSRAHRKPKTGSNARKGTPKSVHTQRAVGKSDAQVVARKRGEEEVGTEENNIVYSISPPPSSLPLPRFSLTRPKAAAASCTAGAVGGGGTVEIGATDDLRRILRL